MNPRSVWPFKPNRRRFLWLTGSGLLSLAVPWRPLSASTYLPIVTNEQSSLPLPDLPEVQSAATYRVGIGRNSDAYLATQRALDASGELNASAVSGRMVVIKPNLVSSATASTGITTDPQVVRAVVDRVLAAGAAQVLIVESFIDESYFAPCGYSFFETYDPQDRIALVDLKTQANQTVAVPAGSAYQQIILPELLFEPSVFYISVAKMKTHVESAATLTMKNSIGLMPESHYRLPKPLAIGRFAMHERGLQQTVVDLAHVRPVDYAVVDGVWAMEGYGPLNGTAVRMDTVVAGRNAVAVDRRSLALMGAAADNVLHLWYAAVAGLGPYSLLGITTAGDTVSPRTFKLPLLPAVVTYPQPSPASFAPSRLQSTTITYWMNRACRTKVDVVLVSDTTSEVQHIRSLQGWTYRFAGNNQVVWNGRDDNGAIVPPGTYTIQVETTRLGVVLNSFATGRVVVT